MLFGFLLDHFFIFLSIYKLELQKMIDILVFAYYIQMNTQEIMAELDEHKQNLPENLYTQLANILKHKYRIQQEKKQLTNAHVYESYDEYEHEEVTNENIDRSIVA